MEILELCRIVFVNWQYHYKNFLHFRFLSIPSSFPFRLPNRLHWLLSCAPPGKQSFAYLRILFANKLCVFACHKSENMSQQLGSICKRGESTCNLQFVICDFNMQFHNMQFVISTHRERLFWQMYSRYVSIYFTLIRSPIVITFYYTPHFNTFVSCILIYNLFVFYTPHINTSLLQHSFLSHKFIHLSSWPHPDPAITSLAPSGRTFCFILNLFIRIIFHFL